VRLQWKRDEARAISAAGDGQAKQQGIDWRGVIGGLRPVTAQIWQPLPEVEKRRFLRHLRPYWEVHHHRLAPQIAQLIGS
jgi:uncharacterized NAD(P)/FAD-binding protein YdhS